MIASEQSTSRAESGSSAREEPTQLPQVVELDEPAVVAEQLPKVKRARTEVEAYEHPGPSSTGEVWAPELRAGTRLITTKDSLLGTNNADLSAQIAHGLGAAVCLPEHIGTWNVMPSSKAFRHIARGLFTVSFDFLIYFYTQFFISSP